VVLLDTGTMTVLDKLSYEGAVTITFTGSLAGFGTVNLVEGTATAALDDPAQPGSMVRIPNGSDTDDAMADWAYSTTVTPGVANVP
jgi:hypothetical protein